MKVLVVTAEQAHAAFGRLAGATPQSDLQDDLCRAEIRIHDNLRTLLDARSSLYGQTYWMVTAAEWLDAAEEDAKAIRAKLDEMGAPHRMPKQEATLRHFRVLPPVDPIAEANRAHAILMGGRAAA